MRPNALDEIGAKLKAIYEEHGPRAIAVYHGTGAYRCVLGGLMGVPLTFKYWAYGLRFQDIPGGLQLGLADQPDPEELCPYLAKDSVVPFDAIKASPSGVRPPPDPRFVLQGPPDSPGRLHLCPPDIAVELTEIAADEAEPGLPFRLTCRRVLHALNSAYRGSRNMRRRLPVNYAHMNPADMAEIGIGEGDLVEIASAHGAIRSLARAEDRLRRGVVSMTHMFGPLLGGGDPVHDGGANVGQLTSLTEHVQPINFMPRFSAVPIKVSAVAADPA